MGDSIGRALVNGPCQPPRNRVTVMAQTVIMLAYSAMKNMAYFMEEYSVQNPETSSVSASGRSKGVRLISAREQMKKTMKAANRNGFLQAYQAYPDWSATIWWSDSEPDTMKTVMMASPAASSYE